MLDLYLSESIDKDTYAQRFDELQKRIQKNLAVIENEKQTLASSPTVSIEFLKKRQREYPTASKKDKRHFLQQIIKQIVINNEKITINWNVK